MHRSSRRTWARGPRMLLEVEDLNVYYGAIHALQGVSFSVDQGEIVTLIGANGAGKSTTLRTISGLLRPRRGAVRFRGEEITMTPAEQIVRLGIGQVPEGRRIFAPLTVRENLEMGAFTRKDPAEIAQSMERVFATARGLMSRPTLLLLDEPSMGLSPIMVEEIFRIIAEINLQGTSILLVEQNALMALQIAHRAYVLETGRIVLQGTAKELRESSKVKEAYLGLPKEALAAEGEAAVSPD